MMLKLCYNSYLTKGAVDGKADNENPAAEQGDKTVEGQVCDVKLCYNSHLTKSCMFFYFVVCTSIFL